MSRYAKHPGQASRRVAAIAAAVALLSGCSVGSALDAVSGAADVVRIGAFYEFSSAGQILDFERMEDALEVLVVADEVGNVAAEGAEAAYAVEPLIEYMTRD